MHWFQTPKLEIGRFQLIRLQYSIVYCQWEHKHNSWSRGRKRRHVIMHEVGAVTFTFVAIIRAVMRIPRQGGELTNFWYCTQFLR